MPAGLSVESSGMTGLPETLALVRPALDPVLISPVMLDRIERVARLLAPIHRAGFECRLEAGDSQVDFQQCVLGADGEPAALAEAIAAAGVAAGGPLSPAWQAIHRLCGEWSTARSQLAEVLQEMWLEFDLPETLAARFTDLRPSVFARFRRTEGSVTSSLTPHATILKQLAGKADAELLQAAVERCAAACSEPAWISHLGVMLGRDSAGLRVNVSGVAVEELEPFLERVGWRGDGARIARLAEELLQFVDGVVVCLAVRETIHPRLGLECFFAPRPGADARLKWLLGNLVRRGLCAPEKRTALLGWPGLLTPLDAAAPWPDGLILRDLLGAPSRLGALTRRWSHVKLDCTPGHPLRCKAYFGFAPAWLEAADPAPAAAKPGSEAMRHPFAESRVGAIRSRPLGQDRKLRSLLRGAMEAATGFLLRARTQSGLWRDFFSDKSLGTGEVYVSAYVACALTQCQLKKGALTRRALHTARATWDRLLARHGPEDGWAWNPFCPQDADSTAWALRLAQGWDELGSARATHARKFLLRQMSPDGGISAYPPGVIRPLGSGDGWATPHASITAVAAVLGLGPGPLEFLRRAQLPDGSWTDYWWDDDEFVTARAVEALRRDASPENHPLIRRAVRWAAGRLGELGSAHGSPFATALCLEVLAPAAGRGP
ncbi:MAG TPA: hypothetical protein VGP61_03785, partial [Gemmatimonadales bacterium]|nr:hypothetical protein [Gemmatimonadales bacterium]